MDAPEVEQDPAPRRLRRPLTSLVDLLSAIPLLGIFRLFRIVHVTAALRRMDTDEIAQELRGYGFGDLEDVGMPEVAVRYLGAPAGGPDAGAGPQRVLDDVVAHHAAVLLRDAFGRDRVHQ